MDSETHFHHWKFALHAGFRCLLVVRVHCVHTPWSRAERTSDTPVVPCTLTEHSQGKNAIGFSICHGEPLLDLPVPVLIAAGSGAAIVSGLEPSWIQLTKRNPVANRSSARMEPVPICQLPFFTLQSMG